MLGGFIGSWHGLMAPILLPDIPCLNFRWSLPVCGEKWKRALGMDISTCWKQWYQWESRWAEHTKQNATIRNPHERWISVIDHIKKSLPCWNYSIEYAKIFESSVTSTWHNHTYVPLNRHVNRRSLTCSKYDTVRRRNDFSPSLDSDLHWNLHLDRKQWHYWLQIPNLCKHP